LVLDPLGYPMYLELISLALQVARDLIQIGFQDIDLDELDVGQQRVPARVEIVVVEGELVALSAPVDHGIDEFGGGVDAFQQFDDDLVVADGQEGFRTHEAGRNVDEQRAFTVVDFGRHAGEVIDQNFAGGEIVADLNGIQALGTAKQQLIAEELLLAVVDGLF